MNEESEANEKNVHVDRLVMPGFMNAPSEWIIVRTGEKVHQYHMPKDGAEIIEAISWMMSVYDDVGVKLGESYGCPYCHLEGTVREA